MMTGDPDATWPVSGGSVDPIFFPTPDELRAWFEAHADTEKELLVGLRRKGSGLPSVSWPEAVDEALCVGWIDGIRRSLDETSYTIRFTPRRPRSTWSAVNLRRVPELVAEGRMRPAGLAAWERRTDERSAIYAYEQRHSSELALHEQAALHANQSSAEFWKRQPAGYRRTATYWVVSAKRPETRARRLAQLIEDSAAGRRIGALIPPGRRPRPG
jgi:uncharacterized protein YdeI (YjbR/CyaY-like superfamily)